MCEGHGEHSKQRLLTFLAGIRPVDFLGNFYMSNTTDVELATVDCDKSMTVEIKHDDKLNEAEGAVVQVCVCVCVFGFPWQ